MLLGKPIADTAMNAGPERQVLPRLGPINDEFIGAVDLFFVAAQQCKQRPPSIILLQSGIADIDRHRRALQHLGLGHRLLPSLLSLLGGR